MKEMIANLRRFNVKQILLVSTKGNGEDEWYESYRDTEW